MGFKVKELRVSRGTALTLEIQEESDVHNMLQAFVNGILLPKEATLRGLPDEESVMRLVDWEKAGDPEFYRKYDAVPETIGEPKQDEPMERWIFNPNRSWNFSGKSEFAVRYMVQASKKRIVGITPK